MKNYPNPTTLQLETVKQLYQFEQQVLDSTTKEELNLIVQKILIILDGVPTAEIHMHDGRIVNSEIPKHHFIEVLKRDVQSYEHFKDAQTGLVLTIDLLVGCIYLIGHNYQSKPRVK
jgi:hypothetical protein